MLAIVVTAASLPTHSESELTSAADRVVLIWGICHPPIGGFINLRLGERLQKILDVRCGREIHLIPCGLAAYYGLHSVSMEVSEIWRTTFFHILSPLLLPLTISHTVL